MASDRISRAKGTRASNKEIADTTLKVRALVNGYVLYHMQCLRKTLRKS